MTPLNGNSLRVVKGICGDKCQSVEFKRKGSRDRAGIYPKLSHFLVVWADTNARTTSLCFHIFYEVGCVSCSSRLASLSGGTTGLSIY